jgi:hypothetical protein
MADYYPLISRAIVGLEKNERETRHAFYERARTALLAELQAIMPALSEPDITRELMALEEAIRRVEGECSIGEAITELAQRIEEPSREFAESQAPSEHVESSQSMSRIGERRSRPMFDARSRQERPRLRIDPPSEFEFREGPEIFSEPGTADSELRSPNDPLRQTAHEPDAPRRSTAKASIPGLREEPSAHQQRVKQVPAELAKAPQALIDAVEFGISHPAGVVHGVRFIVDAWIYQHSDRSEVIRRAELAGRRATFESGGSGAIARGTKVTVRIEIESWEISPPVQTLIWTGEISSVPFVVSPIRDVPGGSTIGRCSFLVRGLRIGQIVFELALGKTVQEDTQVVPAPAIRSAFASYASKDRKAVIARVQGIEKLGVQVFMDVRNLKSGNPYPTSLLQQIDSSDVLYLFWSHHAKRSSWVEKEWRYGMERKGIEFIDPVPLVDPRKAPPPAELADRLHFDDWALASIEYENSMSSWRRFRTWCGIAPK